MDVPIPVAITALIHGSEILLIKRVRGDYVNLWGLPGGKIEKNEHLSEAAVREIFEEAGIEAVFKKHIGFVSEHLTENGNIEKHFLLHVCELIPKSVKIKNNIEGKLEWFGLNNIEKMRNEIIPSDFLIIEKMIKGNGKNYYNCVIEKSGDNHILRKFE